MTAAAAIVAALPLALGCYQRDILTGAARLSGADLRGRAKRYASRYSRSRCAILNRLTAAEIPWRVEVQEHGLRMLVLGDEPPAGGAA